MIERAPSGSPSSDSPSDARRSSLVSALRRLAATAEGPGPQGVERCDFCRTPLPSEHRHLLDIEDRRILCACETCRVRKAEEGRYRPTGRRLLRLERFVLPDEIWARFKIPVGLAFFFHSGAARQVVALYPSPLGATESELELAAWDDLVRENLPLASLEADAEALLVRRTGGAAEYFIAPTDDCYRLVGLLKTHWKGLAGGAAAEAAISAFFDDLRARARAA